MRTILTAALVAAAIVVAYLLSSPGTDAPPGAGAGSGLARSGSAGPAGLAAEGSGDGRIEGARTSAGPTPQLGSGPRPDLYEYARLRGVTGDAVLSILSRMKGETVPPLDREFALRDISRILNAWLADPSRRDADVAFIVSAWKEVDDPAFRWAMSWLMQRIPENRFVEPLLELWAVDASRTVDAVASIGTEQAIATLAGLGRDIDGASPAVRAKIARRIALSEWDGRFDHLKQTWESRARPAVERLAAVEGLGAIPNDPLALRAALDLAEGQPQPLGGDLLGRERDHPERDLRSAAVQAVLMTGSADGTRQLFDRVDTEGHDPALRVMVERHMRAYTGPDISPLMIDRALRQGRVASGIAHYLSRVAVRDQVETIRTLVPLAEDAEARQLLEAALLNAARR